MELTGLVTLPAGAADVVGGSLSIRLLDVTYLDEDAAVLRAIRLPDVTHDSGTESVWAFAWHDVEFAPGRRYVLDAHLAPAGHTDVRSGDWITKRSYPVDPAQPGARHRLHLEHVE